MIEDNKIYVFIDDLKKRCDISITIVDRNGRVYTRTQEQKRKELQQTSLHILEREQCPFSMTKESNVVRKHDLLASLITYHDEDIGVLWVDYATTRPILRLVEMLIEYDLNSEELQHCSLPETGSIGELVSALLHFHDDAEDLKERFSHLKISSAIPRIAIVIESETAEDLSRLTLPFDSREDLYLYEKQEWIIFKSCDLMELTSPAMIKRYIYEFIDKIEVKNKQDVRVYIGTLKSNIWEYAEGYEHCNWLKSQRLENQKRVFFFDYVDQYFKGLIPQETYESVFRPLMALTKLNEKDTAKMIGALIAHNYNYVQTCKYLFVHRNTLIYKIEKLKELFHIDPIHSHHDREFLEYLHAYLVINTK